MIISNTFTVQALQYAPISARRRRLKGSIIYSNEIRQPTEQTEDSEKRVRPNVILEDHIAIALLHIVSTMISTDGDLMS